MSITDWSNGDSHRSNSDSRRRFSIGTEIDDSDHPPGSIVIPITETSPWHISAYDSGESTREITNPKSQSQSSHCPWSSSKSATAATATARSPIIGIRTTMKLPSFAHRRRCHGRRRPSIFPSWRGGGTRSSKSGEPGSPKVSCWGKIVMSEREKEKEKEKDRKRKELKKSPACCGGFAVVLSCVGDRAVRRRRNSQLQLAGVHPACVEEAQQLPDQHQTSVVQEVQRSQDLIEGRQECVRSTEEAEAVGLGKMRRFSSGRRAEAWCADLVVEKEGTVAPRENVLS